MRPFGFYWIHVIVVILLISGHVACTMPTGENRARAASSSEAAHLVLLAIGLDVTHQQEEVQITQQSQ